MGQKNSRLRLLYEVPHYDSGNIGEINKNVQMKL